jgi:hypothetical protein
MRPSHIGLDRRSVFWNYANGQQAEIVLRISKTGSRNRMMHVAALNGASVSELAAQYGLGEKRVLAILLAERHKCEVSPVAVYKELRTGSASLAGNKPAKIGGYAF